METTAAAMRAPSALAEWLPWVNAALFVVQLALTGIGFYFTGDAASFQQQNETLITPEGYAFSIWNVIYLLSMMLLVTDIAYPGLSFYDAASKPHVLRMCFSLSCLTNGGWCVLFNCGFVHLATLDMTVLWLALAALYVFASYSRKYTRPFVWREYICSELCIRVYFAWISAAAVLSWTISLQHLYGGFLPLGSYLGLLGVIIVLALCGLFYGGDPVFSLVAVWALVAITAKDPNKFSGSAREAFVQIQTAAALGAGVLAAIVLVFGVQRLVELRLYAGIHVMASCDELRVLTLLYPKLCRAGAAVSWPREPPPSRDAAMSTAPSETSRLLDRWSCVLACRDELTVVPLWPYLSNSKTVTSVPCRRLEQMAALNDVHIGSVVG